MLARRPPLGACLFLSLFAVSRQFSQRPSSLMPPCGLPTLDVLSPLCRFHPLTHRQLAGLSARPPERVEFIDAGSLGELWDRPQLRLRADKLPSPSANHCESRDFLLVSNSCWFSKISLSSLSPRPHFATALACRALLSRRFSPLSACELARTWSTWSAVGNLTPRPCGS